MSVGPIQRLVNYIGGIPNPSPEYRMEGYTIEDLGPELFENKGREKMTEEVSQMMKRAAATREVSKCPMFG